MKERFLTGILIILVVLPPLICGGLLLDILMLFCLFTASYETVHCLAAKKSVWLMVLLLVATGILAKVSPMYLGGGLALGLVLLFTLSIFNEKYSISDVTLLFSMMTLFTMAVRSILDIYEINAWLMMYVVLATYLTDTGAYFAGYYFGKHKLNERISPKKTIEGSIGGYLIGAIGSFAFGAWMMPELPLVIFLFASLTLPLVGQIGDLAFSAIKRAYQIKDFGSFLPGHGGALDRIDSLLFNLLFFSIALVMIR